jgi:hypothetical protein
MALLNNMAMLKPGHSSKVHDHLAALGEFSSDGFPTRQAAYYSSIHIFMQSYTDILCDFAGLPDSRRDLQYFLRRLSRSTTLAHPETIAYRSPI